jgi:uncharacterized membrane protein YkoI
MRHRDPHDDVPAKRRPQPYRALFIAAALAAIIATGLSGVSTQAQTRDKLQAQAKLSIEEARSIALKLVPGEIMKEELERERGGSGLRYSFDIRQGKKWREVGIDAKTGRVLENSAESANPKD